LKLNNLNLVFLKIIDVVRSLNLLLNVFIFIARLIILLLVCLVIIDLLYAFASAMLDIIEDMLLNFLIFFSSAIVVFSSIIG
jgi:hypothetical protein